MSDKDNSLRATHVWGAAGLVAACFGISFAGFLWLATMVLDNRHQTLNLKEDIVEVKEDVSRNWEEIALNRKEITRNREAIALNRQEIARNREEITRNREAIVVLTAEFRAFREEMRYHFPPPPGASPADAAPKVSKIR